MKEFTNEEIDALPKSRPEALEQNLKHYSGKDCKRSDQHRTVRTVTNHACINCHLITSREFHKANPDYASVKGKNHYENNKEEYKARAKRNYLKRTQNQRELKAKVRRLARQKEKEVLTTKVADMKAQLEDHMTDREVFNAKYGAR